MCNSKMSYELRIRETNLFNESFIYIVPVFDVLLFLFLYVLCTRFCVFLFYISEIELSQEVESDYKCVERKFHFRFEYIHYLFIYL